MKKVLLGCAVLVVLLCGGLMFIGVMFRPTKEQQARQLAVEAREAREDKARKAAAPNAVRDLSVDCSWSKGGFGRVALVNFTLKNKSAKHTYQDVTIELRFAGDSGTVVRETSTVLTIVVPPGKSKRVNEWNAGFIPQQVTRMGCDVLRAQP